MKIQRSFNLFGETVEILVTTEMSNGTMVVGRQVTPPGGGPAPHIHTGEHEFFTVMEGEFDILKGETWHPLKSGESFFVPRGTIHTFRNSGATTGTMLVAVTPGGLDVYLEKLSAFSIPEDLEHIQQLSAEYGVTLLL